MSANKIRRLKDIRARFNRDIGNAQQDVLIEQLYPLIGDWQGRYPNLREIFRADEIEDLLFDAASYEGRCDTGKRTIEFVARSGYRHEPELDNEGKPLTLRRATPIHRAARRQFFDVIPDLFEIYDRYDVNYVDEAGVTHFHVACQFGGYDVVKKFLELGEVDVNCLVPKTGNSPLHFTLTQLSVPCIDTILILIKNGADPNLANNDGWTPAHVIADYFYNHGRVTTLFQISDKVGRPVRVDVKNKSGRTPLHLALLNGYIDLVKFLLRRGADPNLANDDGSTPLHIAANKCLYEAVRILIEFGNEQHRPVLIDAQDKFGDTALHLAARKGHRRMRRLLLRNGANPNLANAKGVTLLHIICTKRDRDESLTFFELTEDEYWPVRVNAQDEEGNTPLHLALYQSKKVIAGFLLTRGADPNAANEFGSTPLHVICERSHLMDDDLAARFFAINRKWGRTVRVNARDASGWTPLERAVASLLPNTVDVLLDNGADLSGFVFPRARDFDRDRAENLDFPNFYKTKLAAGALACVERLTKRGYRLRLSDALTIVKFFARHSLFEKSTEEVERCCNDREYRFRFNLLKFKPDLTLYDLIRLRPEEAAKRLAYTDYCEFPLDNQYAIWGYTRRHRLPCDAHLAEKLSRGFFLRWGLDRFMQLTHYRLPILCCEMIVKDLNNEDLCNVCLATAIKATNNSEWQIEDSVECNDKERPVKIYERSKMADSRCRI